MTPTPKPPVSEAIPLQETAEGFSGGDPVDDLAKVLMLAWAKADPRSSVSQNPVSFVANFADMARAAIAAQDAPEPAQWQLIETAPKDGTRFWAYDKTHNEPRQFECWWEQDFPEWTGWQNDWDSAPEPTHWQPLPAPPSQHLIEDANDE